MADGLATAQPGEEWDQVGLRKLPAGDYLRVLVQRYGDEAIIQLGEAPDPQTFVWRYELRLTATDLAWLGYEINLAAVGVAQNQAASIAQLTVAKTDVETKLAAAATELKDLKDAQATPATPTQ